MTKMVDGAPTVRVEGGRLRGRIDRGVAAFLGISYAGPPLGARRMLPPQPPGRWEGERAATDYGPTCPQGGQAPQDAALFPEVVIPGDDCLNLNVWTPDPGGSGLPVLVWIHGGMFAHGSGSAAGYRGTSFARDGVVFVTVNYRLAAEGFLYLGDGTANVGLLDQIAALEWIQANIAAFGGDPARVTVAGQSAGAMSITALMAMPRARGLFRQAVTQSGAAAQTLTAAAGAAADVRLLTGSNREELRQVFVPAGTIDAVDEPALAAAAGAHGAPDGTVELYRAARPGASSGDLLAAVLTDCFLRVPAIRVAEARAGTGEAGTWMYRFDHRSPSFGGRLGAAHAVELPYVFDLLDDESGRALIGDAPPQAVADTAHSAWVRFVVDGDPGWPRYNLADRSTALIDEGLTVVDDPDGAEREVWAADGSS